MSPDPGSLAHPPIYIIIKLTPTALPSPLRLCQVRPECRCWDWRTGLRVDDAAGVLAGSIGVMAESGKFWVWDLQSLKLNATSFDSRFESGGSWRVWDWIRFGSFFLYPDFWRISIFGYIWFIFVVVFVHEPCGHWQLWWCLRWWQAAADSETCGNEWWLGLG